MQTLFEPRCRTKVSLRDYQTEAHDNTLRMFDSGEVGVLNRLWTGAGKTILSSFVMDTWTGRGPEFYGLVISYEKQLVWQFAQEIEDVLGIKPGIEMEGQKIDPRYLPKIIVASRQSLLKSEGPTEAQVQRLSEYGIVDLGALTKKRAQRYLRLLEQGADVAVIQDDLIRWNERPEANGNSFSRVHKFDWRLNWLLVFDEAHKHARHLKSIRNIVEWFEQNPHSRRLGQTATPKRFDKVSIGHKMFPGVAIDIPLFSMSGRCAVKLGYAVPYVQKYICVEGVDFRQLKKVAGDFDDAELERVLGEEEKLARLVQPVLDCSGDRRTLVFVPGVEMAKKVCAFINARVETKCDCSAVKWHPRLLIGDGAQCECGSMLEATHITKNGNQAHYVVGTVPPNERKKTYEGHQKGKFQFLVIVGLCREGYNDPDISCVAILRPVSKAASSLAEQMKGRGCRPLKGLIEGLRTPEERIAAIAGSEKPDCLIIDLVGVTGLADCASTVQIYADGLPDEVQERAQKKLLDEEETDVQEAIRLAQEEIEAERERIRLEREAAEQKAKEEFERRAKADAQVSYTTQEVGVGGRDPMLATDKQYQLLAFLGLEITGVPLTKKMAGRMIDQLNNGALAKDVAYTNGVREGAWREKRPSLNQIKYLNWKHIRHEDIKTPRQASVLISAHKDAKSFCRELANRIASAKNDGELNALGKELALAHRVLPPLEYDQLRIKGLAKRNALHGNDEEFI